MVDLILVVDVGQPPVALLQLDLIHLILVVVKMVCYCLKDVEQLPVVLLQLDLIHL